MNKKLIYIFIGFIVLGFALNIIVMMNNGNRMPVYLNYDIEELNREIYTLPYDHKHIFYTSLREFKELRFWYLADILTDRRWSIGDFFIIPASILGFLWCVYYATPNKWYSKLKELMKKLIKKYIRGNNNVK